MKYEILIGLRKTRNARMAKFWQKGLQANSSMPQIIKIPSQNKK